MRQYDPTKVVMSWVTPTPLGVIDLADGVVDQEFFAMTKDQARWTREHDLNGNATRVYHSNRGGSFSISYSASSPSNTKLSRCVQADDQAQNVVGPVIVKDLNGNTIGEFDDAFIEDVPDLTFGAERGMRTWTFQYGKARVFAGGHDTV